MLTLGHSTLPIASFLQVLQDNHVHTLVDIRTIPRSRHNPQFERDALAASLHAQGIAYHWLKVLGGLRRPHPDSPNTGWRNPSFRGYADYMQTADFAAAIDELLALAPRLPTQATTAIMCAEAVPWRCHRSLVADALLARSVPVEDILYDQPGPSQPRPDAPAAIKSHRKPHTVTPFARVAGTRVWYPDPDSLFAASPPTSGE